MSILQNFIGGQWTESASTHTRDAVDPRSDEVIARIPVGDAADVDAAVAAARAAQPAWAALPLEERLRMLEEFIDAVEPRLGELAAIESREMGKPLAIAKVFAQGAAAGYRQQLRVAKTYPFRSQIRGERGLTEVLRVPLGVAALIIPWNFPVVNTLRPLVPLLASGNTVVLKPSERATMTPTSVFESNSLPPGVLNLVLGDGTAGRPLSAHPNVQLVHFTGSVATGRSIAAASGQNLSRAVLELGGKDAAIIDRGVDPVATARAVATGSFLNSGQICTGIERVYVHKEVAGPFLEALTQAAADFAPGGAQEIGPLVDRAHRELVHERVRDAATRGATIVIGGELPDGPGCFYPPTIVTDVNETMRITHEEIFGPVITVETVPDFGEGLQRAALGEYGLAGSVFTQDPAHIEQAMSLPVGQFSVNEWLGDDGVGIMEPAGISGLGAVGPDGGDFDAATRAMSAFIPDVPAPMSFFAEVTGSDRGD